MALRRAGLLLAAALLGAAASRAAASPSEDFQEAIRLDLDGKSQLAFILYLRAAAAGLSQAQFNVAVMLDSGRGARRDVAEAARWYARAAAHGNRRAAYNLGILYEAGEGVPQNAQLSRAWFAASGLAAPLPPPPPPPHTDPGHSPDDTVILTSPETIFPPPGSRPTPEMDGIVLIWTSRPQPVPVSFYVELRSIEASTSREVLSSPSTTSSIFATLPKKSGEYAWRVFAISSDGQRYRQSAWQRFDVKPDDQASSR